MSSLATKESKIIRWTRAISLIGLIGVLILATITVVEVLLRWLLDFPILGVADVSSLVIAVAVASCFPLVFAERGNITVRMVGTTLGPRSNNILEAFGSLVTIIILCLLIWQLWIYTGAVTDSNETTWVVNWPIAPWYWIVTVLFALCVPVQAVTLFNQIKSAFNGKGGADRKAER